MNPYQKAVEEFHVATDSRIGAVPNIDDPELRAKLIMEEAVETVAALGFNVVAEIRPPKATWEVDPDWTYIGPTEHFEKDYSEPNFLEAIDGFCDLLYVVFGSAVTMGIDLDPFFAEVHRANMAKTTGPKRADGKQLKPDNWQPPNHAPILAKQTRKAKAWQKAIAETEWLHPYDQGYPHSEVSEGNFDFPDHGQG